MRTIMENRKQPLPNPENPFVHVKLNLTEEERELLANLDITSPKELMGTLEYLEGSLGQINDYIQSIGNNDAITCSALVRIILQIAHEMLSIFQQETAYIMLRTFIPGVGDGSGDCYETPRWHQDGYYYAPYNSGSFVKAAIPLKGAGTLFYKSSPEEAEKFKLTKETDRKIRAELLSDDSKRDSTPPGHASIFMVAGDEDTIHTEPHIGSPRFFMSVLPRKKQQVEELDEKNRLPARMRAEGKSADEIREAEISLLLRNILRYNK